MAFSFADPLRSLPREFLWADESAVYHDTRPIGRCLVYYISKLCVVNYGRIIRIEMTARFTPFSGEDA